MACRPASRCCRDPGRRLDAGLSPHEHRHGETQCCRPGCGGALRHRPGGAQHRLRRHSLRAARGDGPDLQPRAQPVLVAGTGLYLRSLTDPMEVPGRWPELRPRRSRNELLARARRRCTPNWLRSTRSQRHGWSRPTCAGDTGPGSHARQRPPRSARSARDSTSTTGALRAGGAAGVRPVLAERIAASASHDVAGLACRSRVAACRVTSDVASTARQALGYKGLIAHLEGTWSFDEAVAAIIVRTRQFAVRQERWFHCDPRIRWVHIEHDPVAEVVPLLFPS